MFAPPPDHAVWIAPDGDGEVLTPEPQVEGFARAALRKGPPDHAALPSSWKAVSCSKPPSALGGFFRASPTRGAYPPGMATTGI